MTYFYKYVRMNHTKTAPTGFTNQANTQNGDEYNHEAWGKKHLRIDPESGQNHG